MPVNPIVLMVSSLTGSYDTMQRAIAAGGHRCDTRRADDMATALARIAGGGVALVFMDVSEGQDTTEILKGLSLLREKAPQMAVSLWSDRETNRITEIAAQAKVDRFVISVRSPQDLNRILTEALTGQPMTSGKAEEAGRPPSDASVIAFMGVKGGSGTTTAAMNTATALTATGTVVLAEIRPGFSSLHGYFQPGRMSSGYANRQALESGGPGLSPALLWPVPGVPGLRVFFGPQSPEDCGEIEPEWGTMLLRKLAGEADFVVLDLPVSLGPANRDILAASHYLMLTLDASAAALRLAKLTLQGIHSWSARPASIGAVIVKQRSEGNTLLPAEMEAALEIPAAAVIPPAPDLCLNGERSRLPMMKCDPESLAADSFVALAGRFALRKKPAAVAGAGPIPIRQAGIRAAL